MLNKEKFAKEILDIACSGHSIALNKVTNKPVSCNGFDCHCCVFFDDNNDCVLYLSKWANSEYKESILTDEEKTYLENVIKPFRDKVKYIKKSENEIGEFIKIVISKSYSFLPSFEKGKYYREMELYKEYTLKELGLFESEVNSNERNKNAKW